MRTFSGQFIESENNWIALWITEIVVKKKLSEVFENDQIELICYYYNIESLLSDSKFLILIKSTVTKKIL